MKPLSKHVEQRAFSYNIHFLHITLDLCDKFHLRGNWIAYFMLTTHQLCNSVDHTLNLSCQLNHRPRSRVVWSTMGAPLQQWWVVSPDMTVLSPWASLCNCQLLTVSAPHWLEYTTTTPPSLLFPIPEGTSVAESCHLHLRRITHSSHNKHF